MKLTNSLAEINDFLSCPTPHAWLTQALENQSLLLIDHAHCEKKAASTALSLIFQYTQHEGLLQKLSRLAREELRHFEKVLTVLKNRQINFERLQPSRYAHELQKHIRTYEPARLVDTLIVGAFIEARSCERFARIAPYLDKELQGFYNSLVHAEARHFKDYITLAEAYADACIKERISYFADLESQLILSFDNQFRFHSGVPSVDT